MDAMDWVALLGVLVGAATLVVTVPVLVLTRRQERRSTERSIIEWYASEAEPGVIQVRNAGLDTAHEVTLEVWDRHDLAMGSSETMQRDGVLAVRLPHRMAHGPDPVNVPTPISPRVPDEPPKGPDLPDHFMPAGLRQTFEASHAKWEMLKKMQDGQDETVARLKQEAEQGQVTIRVTWRSALGTWASTFVSLA